MTKINTMCLTCAKFGVDCKGTTDQTYTGCVRRTPLPSKAQALQMYKYTKSATLNNKTIFKILDELDELRRESTYYDDFTFRAIEADIAKMIGIKNRNEWTEALMSDTNTKYHKYYGDSTK